MIQLNYNLRLSKTTYFVSNFVIENNVPMYSLYDEGRIVYDNGLTISSVEVNMKDHLGNVRAVFDITTGQVKQTNTYYPFGMQNSSLSANTTTTTNFNEYKYNGKMFQDENGLNWYDYGARFYDAVVGRWWSVDPLCEVNRRWSPYKYANDNPIIFIDQDGMLDELYITGNASDQATADLDNKTSLTLTRDSNGKISASGTAVTEEDKQLLEAVNSQSVKVNITANNSKTVGDGKGSKILNSGGSFLGNTINTKFVFSQTDFGFEDAVGDVSIDNSDYITTVSTSQ